MPSFGTASLAKLSTCHLDLQKICVEAIKIMDFAVTDGYRSKERQDAAYREGRSTVQFPNSKHNKGPSKAVDLAPWPIDWEDLRRFYLLAGIILGVAHRLGVKIRWGGDWDMDYDLDDQKFIDLPHFELI